MMNEGVTLNGRIEYPKEMESEIQEVCDLVNQGEQEEAFRLLRELLKQDEVDIILETPKDHRSATRN